MPSSDGGRDERPRRLVRTRRGRLIGGVCSGLGAHFDVDPILFRIVFVGVTFFAGVGIGIYLAILLLVPEEGASRAPIRLRASSWRTILGVAAVITAASIGLSAAAHAALGSAWGFGAGLGSIGLVGIAAVLVWLRLRRGAAEQAHTSADRRLAAFLALATAVTAEVTLLGVAGAWLAGTENHIAAWAVVVIGALLVLSAFTRSARWLLPPAVAFTLAVAVIAAAHVDLHGGFGDRTYRPRTLSEVRDGYRLGAGRLEIDLRQITFPPGDTPLHVRLGVGELVVLVPEDVCVATRAHIGGGYVGALELGSGGLDVDWINRPSPAPHAVRLVVDGSVGLGALLVSDHPVGGGFNGDGGSFQAGALGSNDACRGQPGSS
jgi:phage shock protein PspC (stress-responsive transcriptional regulator)